MSYAKDILNGKYKIPVSALGDLKYCEYSIYLRFVKNIDIKNQKMIIGEMRHASLDKAYFEKGEISLEEALETSLVSKEVCCIRAFQVENKWLKGFIDEVQIYEKEILIIDDKSIKGQVWEGMKLQVFGYCSAYKDSNSLDRTLYGCIRDLNSREFVWREIFNEEKELKVKHAIDQILNIFSEKLKPKSSENPSKCRPCKYNYVCDKKVATVES